MRASLHHGGLVGRLLFDRGQQLGQVVREEPQPGVTRLGLDDGRPPRRLGLATQGSQLAADLAAQIGDPGQVGLHRLQLAQRLFLALAVLEDARGLFDEAPPLLGRRAQDGVQLALANNDVHLAPDAGVG